MKRNFITLFILLLSCSAACATNYYFSSVSGDDSRTLTQAQNPATPWRTVSKLNAFFKSLQPGDSVLFKCGETFYGTIKVTKSGTSGHPIVLTSYGTGNKPIITSLIKISKWAPLGNGVWESYHVGLDSTINVVLMHGVVQEMGRFPNSNSTNAGYLTIASVNGNNSITDPSLSVLPNWKGAEVVIRKNRWTIDRNIIKSHAGSTLYYKSASKYTPKVGYGFFIQNHIKTLDKEGEWFYDSKNKKISIYYGTKPPPASTVEVAALDNIIHSSGSSHIVLKNLVFRGSNKDIIKIIGGSDLRVNNCEITFAGKSGVKLAKHSNFKIENSIISHSNSTGINIPSGNNKPLVKNNKVKYTGVMPGMGEIDGTLGIGIQLYSDAGVIEYNDISNTGYNGIAIKLKAVKVRNNFIDKFCLIKDDGGGIYSANGSNKTFSEAEISGNIVLNGVGAVYGTDSQTSNAEGIYMDDNSNGVVIKNNVVANCQNGLYLHNARNIVIRDNTLFNNKVQLHLKHSKSGNAIRDLNIQNNIFFSKQSNQWVTLIETIKNDINQMGIFDYNYYSRPLDQRIIFSTTTISSDTRTTKLFDLEGWRQHSGEDLQSKEAPFRIKPYTYNKLIGLNKVENGNFDSQPDDIFANKCDLSWENDGMLDGGYLQITPTSESASIVMGIGALEAHKKYILKYSTSGGEGDITIGTFLRMGGKPYKPITPPVYRKTSFIRNEYEVLFEPSESHSMSSLVFTADQQKAFCLDNIQLFEADASVTNPDNFIRFEYNSSRNYRSIPLEEKYRDVFNNIYNEKVLLSPYSSVILIKDAADVLESSVETIKRYYLQSEISSVARRYTDDTENNNNVRKIIENRYQLKAKDEALTTKLHFTEKDSLTVYPVPTDHLLHLYSDIIMGNNFISVHIMSVLGQFIRSIPIPISGMLNTTIDVSDLKEGTYIVQITSGNLSLYKKFIKY